MNKTKAFGFILLCYFFSFLAYYLKTEDNNFHGADIYIGFSIFYFLLANFLIKHLPFSPRLLIFIAGLGFIGSPPLFENDHYRYIWEGKVVLAGENPYLKSPANDDLDSVSFSKRHLIAYNKLTSIYPPLSQALFTISGLFSYPYALIFLQLISLILLTWIIPYWFSTADKFFILLTPYLLKEFVQSVHIDLMAVVFFTVAVHANFQRTYLHLFLSFLTKILSIIILPFRMLQDWEKHKKVSSFIIVFPMSIFAFYFFLQSGSDMSGSSAYINYWHWNSFLMGSLLKLGLGFKNSRLVLLLLFLVFYIALLLRAYIKGYRENYLSLVFSFLFLFSPVLHPWYLLWLFPLVKKNKLYYYFIFSSVLAYIPYSDFKLDYWFTIPQFLLLIMAIRKDLKEIL